MAASVTASQDLLGRQGASLVTLKSNTNNPAKHSIYSFSSHHPKIMQGTLKLLFNKDSPNTIATLWIDDKGIKILTEVHSISQTIVFWQKDLFDSYIFEGQEDEFNIKIPLKELLVFFESLPLAGKPLVDIFILESNELLLQLKSGKVSLRMRITSVSDSVLQTNVFNFGELKPFLFITTNHRSLSPTFGTMEWNHLYLSFDANVDGNLVISSSSVADSISTHYTFASFNQFECNRTFSARYRLNHFKVIRKAIKHSKRVTILINSNKLLYIECLFESEDRDVESEIAFYVSAQIEDVPPQSPSELPTQVESKSSITLN